MIVTDEVSLDVDILYRFHTHVSLQINIENEATADSLFKYSFVI